MLNLHSWQATLAARRNGPHFLPCDLSWSSSHVSLSATHFSQVAPQLRLCVYRMETVLPKELVTLELCPCTQPCAASGGDEEEVGRAGAGVVRISGSRGRLGIYLQRWAAQQGLPWHGVLVLSIPDQEGLGSGGAPTLASTLYQCPIASRHSLVTYTQPPVSISIQKLSKLTKWSYRIHFLPLVYVSIPG